MGLVYLGALIVGLGILLVQVAMGGRDGGGHHADAGHHADKDLAHGEAGLVALFVSTRFWIFATLAFGLSGSLLHYLDLAGGVATFALAAAAGIGSGLFAALAFRVVRRASQTSTALASDATGKVGRVLVPCAKGKVGQVRVELQGQSVDLLATTEEDDAIARGEAVLVEEIRSGVAQVSRRPDALS